MNPPAAAKHRAVSPARACAYTVVRRVFEHGAYADRALAAEARALDPRDRAFATALAYGAIQRRRTLDHVAQRFASRPLERLDPPVLAALRLGLYQLLYLGGVADYAAVDESVELAKRARPAAAGLVNAILRRGAAEGSAILAELDDADPGDAAILHSVPEWLAQLWWTELGAGDARELLRRVNDPAESAIRVNTLVASPAEVAGALPVPSHPAPGVPEGLVVEAGFDAQSSDPWKQGAIMPQSRGSMLVAGALAPVAGERVLDLCAAPGGKTTHIAALLEDRGEVVAVERHAGRAAALERTCLRMHTRCVRVEVADAAHWSSGGTEFDRVLVDPPCSGLGTLQSRPDRRWRASPQAIEELAAVQSRILAAGAACVAPGGTVVYSVCTISRREGEMVLERFLREHPEFAAEDLADQLPQWAEAAAGQHLQLLPSREGTDGFFIARCKRLRAPR
ncbi:MAG TPA: 16S rRNA (cytosine(967)-C(5))-methyltransferase RsmB [Solirubrobacteraceae bacterium]|nr:16S rRNA (cytosine(967)-C(5))-methyltransferase RsmB [Solirubrobacteraceae bacterium]